jgi:hypothetical protein
MVVLLALAMHSPASIARSERLFWNTFPPLVAEALEAFRNSDNGLASETTMNMDGPVTGRSFEGERSLNFDASRHLSWLVVDLNGDRLPEVFLLIELDGANRMPWGVVMQKIGDQWRVACEFQHEIWRNLRGRAPSNPLTLLDQRTHGWRHFGVLSGTFGWQRSDEMRGAMDCMPIIVRPTRLLDMPTR